ncbi:MAG: hypothetical protein ACQESK_08505 [Bacteroidota bacterium]
MKKLLVLTIIGMFLLSCSSDDDNTCNDTEITTTTLESEYGCENTKHQIDIGLTDDYTIISSQTDYNNVVTGNCQPDIDFSTYKLVIGKKGLSNGNDSIDIQFIENCTTGEPTLTFTFNQNDTEVASNLTYHALIPNHYDEMELVVDLVIN